MTSITALKDFLPYPWDPTSLSQLSDEAEVAVCAHSVCQSNLCGYSLKQILSQLRVGHSKISQSMHFAYCVGISSYSNKISSWLFEFSWWKYIDLDTRNQQSLFEKETNQDLFAGRNNLQQEQNIILNPYWNKATMICEPHHRFSILWNHFLLKVQKIFLVYFVNNLYGCPLKRILSQLKIGHYDLAEYAFRRLRRHQWCD